MQPHPTKTSFVVPSKFFDVWPTRMVFWGITGTLMDARFAYRADTIEIIDSIPENESQTARRLEDHINDLYYDDQVMKAPVTRHTISTSAELKQKLSRLTDTAANQNQWPLIHIEAHGDNEGLHLAKGDFVRWAEVQPLFLQLNKATRNHLFIVLAACKGFHGIKAMLDVLEHAVSFRLLWGPTENITSGDLENALKWFYTSLIRTGDLNAAANEAQNYAPTFRMYLAEEAFIAGWHKAVEQFAKTGKPLQQKTEQIITMMNNAGLTLPPRPHAATKEAIRKFNIYAPFQAYKKRFFMLDLFPELEKEVSGLTLESCNH